MFHYLFTNDLRITNLESVLIEAAKCFRDNTVPSASEDKNANNNMNTLGFYFNLTQKSNCAKECSEGNVRKVVLNFIKKFQFPNPRTTDSLKDCIEDGIWLAPMRIILQTLYMMSMICPEEAYLSKKEIADYIFFNEKVAKTKKPDIAALVNEIVSRRDPNNETDIPDDEKLNANGCYWKQCKRQVREMVKVLSWSGCVVEEKNGNIKIHHDNLSRDNEADLFEIITFNDFWIPNPDKNAEGNKASYQAYIDVEPNTDTLSVDLYDDILKHKLFGIHIMNENDALSEERPHICIGWSKLEDLSDLSSKEELSEKYVKVWPNAKVGSRGQNVGQIWRFIKEVGLGDYILYADGAFCHIARIESDYYYDANTYEHQDSDYTNVRDVIWLKKNIKRTELSEALQNSLRTGMSIWAMNDYRAVVADLLKGTYSKDEGIDNMDEESMELKFKTGLDLALNKDCSRLERRNRIVFGAPGTGKSFMVNNDRETLLKENKDIDYERVTFHPDYSYANFVGTYKPVPTKDEDDKESITYKYVPGPFMRVYVEALKSAQTDHPKPYLLIIEEINRANVAAVFGDVFQLLDRGDDGVSEYPIQASEDIKKYLSDALNVPMEACDKIRIPDNMFIWATMNSADQGVFPMDTAFKRRWDFTYIGIDDNDDEIQDKYVDLGVWPDSVRVEWNDLRKAINEALAELRINEDKQLGPYFISKNIVVPKDGGSKIDSKEFTRVFKNKVLMYLYEDAAKQKHKDLFGNYPEPNSNKQYTRYSEICNAFDTRGISIFSEKIVNKLKKSTPLPYKSDAEDNTEINSNTAE